MTIPVTSIDLPVPTMGGRGLGLPSLQREAPVSAAPIEGQGAARALAAPSPAGSVWHATNSAFAGFDVGSSLVMIVSLLFVLNVARRWYVSRLRLEASEPSTDRSVTTMRMDGGRARAGSPKRREGSLR